MNCLHSPNLKQQDGTKTGTTPAFAFAEVNSVISKVKKQMIHMIIFFQSVCSLFGASKNQNNARNKIKRFQTNFQFHTHEKQTARKSSFWCRWTVCLFFGADPLFVDVRNGFSHRFRQHAKHSYLFCCSFFEPLFGRYHMNCFVLSHPCRTMPCKSSLYRS